MITRYNLRWFVPAMLLLTAIAFAVAPPHAEAQFVQQSTFAGTSTHSGNVYAVTLPNWTSNVTGVPVTFIPDADNTGATTMNITAVGAVNVYRKTSLGLEPLSGHEFATGVLTTLTYDGTQFEITSRGIDNVGSTIELRASTAPPGYLIEDGSCVSQTTYAALYAYVGTTYGSCSAGLFALPDSRGTMFAAADNQGANGAANRITSAGSGCTATSPVLCGLQNATIARSGLPNTSVTATSTPSNVLQGGTLVGGFQSASGTSSAYASGASPTASAISSTFNLNGNVTQTTTTTLNPTLIGYRAIKY